MLIAWNSRLLSESRLFRDLFFAQLTRCSCHSAGSVAVCRRLQPGVHNSEVREARYETMALTRESSSAAART